MKTQLFQLIILSLLIACSSNYLRSEDNKKSNEINEKLVLPKFTLAKISIKPGDVRQLNYHLPESFLKLFSPTRIICANKDVFFQVQGLNLVFFLAESYFSKLNPYQCELKYRSKKPLDKIEHSATLYQVNPVYRKFAEEKLKVNPKRVSLSKKNKERVAQEQEMLNLMYAATPDRRLFDKPFIAPLKSKLTSHYGKKRTFNGVRKSQHLGNDFRAGIGTKIKASNSGKVVLAQELFYLGKGVIIDHGVGVFTTYGHLSKIAVTKGQMVKQGQILGLSGASGRVTGPHLHWGTKVNGEWIDGFSLIDETSIKK